MFCPTCNNNVDEFDNFCRHCGNSLKDITQPSGQTRKINTSVETPDIPDYIAQSILVTLLCCIPFGILAIAYGTQVNKKLRAGDFQGALQASSNARLFLIISFVLGIATLAVFLLMFLMGISDIYLQ